MCRDPVQSKALRPAPKRVKSSGLEMSTVLPVDQVEKGIADQDFSLEFVAK
jgi:hypothetical protein